MPRKNMKNLIQVLHVQVVWFATLSTVRSFQPHSPCPRETISRQRRRRPQSSSSSSSCGGRLLLGVRTLINSTPPSTTTDRLPCFYRSPSTGAWKKRIELKDLKIGDKVTDCLIVQELFGAITGPKVFCDCGVARFSARTSEWKIVNAMLRLDRKESVARKRAARLRKKKSFSAFVSRIRIDNQQLEICLAPEDAERNVSKTISASQLTVGQEVIGEVVRIEPFGAFVDVGANRLGLLHIRKVADLYGHYIDKAKGLADSGFERGSRVRLQVESNDRQRLFLDFTQDVKAEAVMSREAPTSGSRRATNRATITAQQSDEPTLQLSAEEEAAWASSASKSTLVGTTAENESEHDDKDEYDYDEYDEDRDIEDALGLGTY